MHIIRQNDTLRSIATKRLGEVNRWVELVLLNNLVPPYIGEVGKSYIGNVVFPGNAIQLPTNSFSDARVYSSSKLGFSIEEQLLGTDIGLSDTNDLVIVNTASGKDLMAVSGLQNLRQALYNRLNTARGALLYYPLYGTNLKANLGKVSSSMSGPLLTADCVQTLQSDPRVGSVEVLATTEVGLEEIEIDTNVMTITGITEPLKINVRPDVVGVEEMPKVIPPRAFGEDSFGSGVFGA